MPETAVLSPKDRWRLNLARWGAAAALALLSACGGGGGGAGGAAQTPPVVTSPAVDPKLALGDGLLATMLSAVPTSSGGGGMATTLTIHYRRPAGDYTGWTLHTYGAAVETSWTSGRTATGTDSFGQIYEVPLAASSGNTGYIFHNGDTKDHGGADQSYTLKPGKNEIWRIQGDNSTYPSNPTSASAPDITTVRVHYKRFDGSYAPWGLHLWPSSGLDTGRVPAGVTIDQWGAPVAFNAMPNYSADTAEVVFDIPVLNPKADSTRKSLEFIIHGFPPNSDNKDGRPDNIRVDFAGLTIAGQVGHVWLVQSDATVYTALPDTRSASTKDARAFWLNKQLIQWPRVGNSGIVKLYYSATGQIAAPLDRTVSGSDGSITLDKFTGTVPAAAATRFKWIDAGAVFSVKAADQSRMGTLHQSQLVLVQEDASGKVQNATTAQNPGALDDLYAAAKDVADLGVTISGGNTRFKLWAPTAQKVYVFTYDTATGVTVSADDAVFDTATGVWSAQRTGDLSGKYYRYGVEVFVRGTGLVRNLLTDPYSISLTTDSARSYIASLSAANLKPAGWDASAVPAKVSASTDLMVYELHIRDFSGNDSSVSATSRGKYGAFTEAGSNGMKHLKALADAGLTMGEPRGIAWSPLQGLHLSDDLGLNYIVTATPV